MPKIKTAVFGAGFVGRVHVEGIRRLGNVEVSAVVAITSELAAQLAAELHIPRSEGDYRRILEDPAIDAVHICAPNALHSPMAQDALKAGKHVLCEKPLAVSASEGRKMA